MHATNYKKQLKELTEIKYKLTEEKNVIFNYFSQCDLDLYEFYNKSIHSILISDLRDVLNLFFNLMILNAFLAVLLTIIAWIISIEPASLYAISYIIIIIGSFILFFKEMIIMVTPTSISAFILHNKFGLSNEYLAVSTIIIFFFILVFFRFIVTSKRKSMADNLIVIEKELEINDNNILKIIREPIISNIHTHYLLSFDDIKQQNDPCVPTQLIQQILDKEVANHTIEAIGLPQKNVVLYKSLAPINPNNTTTTYLEIN